MSKPKKLEDFPQFLVETVHRTGMSGDGYNRYELKGNSTASSNKLTRIGSGCCLVKKLCLRHLDIAGQRDQCRLLSCNEVQEPEVAGQSLAYLSPYWQAYHVWMVLDPAWAWERRQFKAVDAYAQDYDAKKHLLLMVAK